jgi:hypothetical protein
MSYKAQPQTQRSRPVAHLLPAPELGRIDSDEQSLDPALGRVLDDFNRPPAVGVDVQLKKLDLAGDGGVDHLVERARSERRDLDEVRVLLLPALDADNLRSGCGLGVMWALN